MKTIYLSVTAVLLSLLVLCLPACSLFRSACDTAMPVLTQGGSLSADAMVAVTQVRAYAESLPVADPTRDKILKAISHAEVTLRAANASLAAASSACSQPDLRVIFQSFVQAWDAIKPLISLVGAAAAPTGQLVPDPAVYSALKK